MNQDTEETLINLLKDGVSIIKGIHDDMAMDYIKLATRFVIAIPEGMEIEHVCLIDVNTNEVLKKINLGKLLSERKL